MQIERARYLVSAAGREALAGLDPRLGGLDAVRLAAELRRSFPPAQASALAEQVTLTAHARRQLDETRLYLLTREGLEMMTRAPVAERRAGRLAALGLPVIDLTCGLGGDLGALAATGTPCAGLEQDPAVALLAAANTGAPVARGDCVRPPFALSGAAVLLDPSRRSSVGRTSDPRAFSPPWDDCLRILSEARAGCLKAPPVVDHRSLPEACETEFVQLGRTLREAAIYIGEGAEAGLRTAVLLPANATLTSTEAECEAAPVAPGPFIADPESCVTRAGLVRHLGARIEARVLDPSVAYLTGDVPVITPLAAWFEVLEAVPFSVARLRTLLRERRWRVDEVRRRAFPVEPDELLRLLGKLEGEPVALLCTTIAGERTVFVAKRIFSGPGAAAP